MAKRKRLTPAQTDYLDATPAGLETKPLSFPAAAPRAPIAQVAGDASASAALEELAGEVKRARDEGRMIQSLALDAVDIGYLARDRIAADTEGLGDLITSIRERGQQAPVEVVALEDGRYGLISGWRRLTALQRLYAETGDARFATILAILRQPETAMDAYVSMVEENEIRLGLSYYERARIAAKAVEQGVFEGEKQALNQLFSTASRPKRSKIKSFLALYHAADDLLRYPNAINERLGVALSRELLDGKDKVEFLRDMLVDATPKDAEAELKLLQDVLDCLMQNQSLNPGLETKPKPAPKAPAEPYQPPQFEGESKEHFGFYTLVHGVEVSYFRDRVELKGRGVTKTFRDRLFAWIIAEQERIVDEIEGK